MNRGCVFVVSLLLAGPALADPCDTDNAMGQPRWLCLAEPRIDRSLSAGAMLGDGSIVFVGGDVSAEIYDPMRGGRLIDALPGTSRFSEHSITLLPSGDLLVVGGHSMSGDSGVLADAEIFRVDGQTWSTVPNAPFPVRRHTATRLQDGRVLIAGGFGTNDAVSDRAAIFDPVDQTWVETPRLDRPRAFHTATRLADGRVLIAGGQGVAPFDWKDAEIYDPDLDSWISVGPMRIERRIHTATLLPSGEVLIAGGSTLSEIYDPVGDVWQLRARTNQLRIGHQATLLSDGRVWVTGGCGTIFCDTVVTSSEVYDPIDDTWTRGPDMQSAFALHLAFPAAGSGLFVAASSFLGPKRQQVLRTRDGDSLVFPLGDLDALDASAVLVHQPELGTLALGEQIQRLDLASGTWSELGSTPSSTSAAAILLPSGEPLLVRSDSAGSTAVRFDADWTPRPELSLSLPAASPTLALELVPGGKVLALTTTEVEGAALLAGALIFEDSEGALVAKTVPTPERPMSPLGWDTTLDSRGRVVVTGVSAADSPVGLALVFDPRAEPDPPPHVGAWQLGPRPEWPRRFHRSVLLMDGSVLVTGGWSGLSERTVAPVLASERWHPDDEGWRPSGTLHEGRGGHSATVLPDGRVLIAGGSRDFDPDGAVPDSTALLRSVEIYDPWTGDFTAGVPMEIARAGHAALLTEDGTVVFVGGQTESGNGETEVYDPYASVLEALRPVIEQTSTLLSLAPGAEALTLDGTGFEGLSEGAGGTRRQVVANHPLVSVRHLQSGHVERLRPDGLGTSLGEDAETGGARQRLTNLDYPALMTGQYYLTVFTQGAPSRSAVIDVHCGLSIEEHPQGVTVEPGEAATFSVRGRGIGSYQWLKDGVPIPGATEDRYTTDRVAPSESGTRYSVRVRGLCSSEELAGATEIVSETARLTVFDDVAPEVSLISPVGGELWVLSSPGEEPRGETVSWTMRDNVRICEVFAELLYADSEGVWQAVTGDAALMTEPDIEDDCRGDGVRLTAIDYQVPDVFPSGTLGSRYKVRVRVADDFGNATTAESDLPFFIAQPDNTAVKTLIVWNRRHMEALYGLSEADELSRHLQVLADDPNVTGWVVDLGQVVALRAAFDAWIAEPPTIEANDLLFGCDAAPCSPSGVHGHLRSLLESLRGVDYLLVVGDDRIVPMARLADRTPWPERAYTQEADDLDAIDAAGSRAAMDLARDLYLSDDLLGSRRELDAADLPPLPITIDLMPGRLVETPAEIVGSILRFLGSAGGVDLDTINAERPEVLITGYDFLIDAARTVQQLWQADDTFRVDAELISSDWGSHDLGARRDALAEALDSGPAIAYLFGHATHNSEGVPGETLYDIQGLSSDRIYDPENNDCRLPPLELDRVPDLVLAAGCHGGLSLPGSCAVDADRTLDLPQAYLARGALAYVANTGYGWGLEHGVGLSERLLELAADEMSRPLARGEVVTLGDVIRAAKNRYGSETPFPGPLDEKVIHQWSLYGFPMVRVSAAANRAVSERREPSRRDRRPAQLSTAREGERTPSPFLTILSQTLTFGPESFQKLSATGELLDATSDGCPDSRGCYYRLNGLSTGTLGEPGLPIEPFEMQPDLRFSGASHHGILWLGGRYREEANWRPVLATPVSNTQEELDSTQAAPLPRTVMIGPRGGGGGRPVITGSDASCRRTDPEPISLIHVAGELVDPRLADEGTSRHRNHDRTELELFFLNDPVSPDENCDRVGPEIGSIEPARSSSGITWSVTAGDRRGPDASWNLEDVWRVVVTCTDNTLDEEGFGYWISTELEPGPEPGEWRGVTEISAASPTTCLVQSVDRRGNVSWYESVVEPSAETSTLPALPEPFVVPSLDALFVDDFEDGTCSAWSSCPSGGP